VSALTRKVLVLAVLIACFAVGMAYLLISFKIGNAHRELRHGRFELIAQDIDRVVEQSLGMGLPFDGLGQITEAMERRRSADSELISIDITNPRGEVIYSTDPQRVGVRSPTEWSQRVARLSSIASPVASSNTKSDGAARSQRWRAVDDNERVAGTIVRSSFDEPLGAVAVRYQRAAEFRAAAQLRESLGPVSLVVLVLTFALLFVFIRGCAWWFERAITRAQARLRSTAGAVDDVERSGWEQLVVGVATRLNAARTALSNFSQTGSVRP
jgi:HAMP domain-containing protein